ncbi:MAG: ATP-binding protein [Candidatus Eremiobacterota bacterium]
MSRLLIVDDNEQNLYMLEVLLVANGFQVQQACNGAQALELARTNPPDMIVTDILMPVMDGFALCRAWKEDELLKNIPLIFYTATYTDQKDEDFALSLGAERFIIKPAEPERFLAIVRETINNRNLSRPVTSFRTLEEAEYYREYSEALIRKLEDKMLQLEEANRTLERDMVERKRMEDALRKSEKKYLSQLEETVRERTKELNDAQEKLIGQEKLAVLGHLSGSVGHELLNPLGVINNAVYYLKMVLEESGDNVKEYLDIIASEVYKSKKIISDLLNFSRTNTVAMKKHVRLLLLILEILNRQNVSDKIKIINGISSEDFSVFADPDHMEQILENLIRNACQSMPGGGELIINGKNTKDYVEISITDTGCGIPEEHMRKIFEPLFTTRSRGIGLGLAVTKKFIEVNGGHIDVKSVENKGTSVTVTFPVEDGRT